MNEYTILAVDDEEDILNLVRYNLAKEGCTVFCAKSGKECLDIVKTQKLDLILLDVMMPKITGIEVCKILKSNKKYKDIPVVMLTAKSTENDILTGLDCGADDYITKPFSIKILIARISAILRRVDTQVEKVVSIENLKIDFTQRQVYLDGEIVEFTYSRFEILALLVKSPGTVFPRKDIVKKVKGDNYPVTERSIDVHIVELRKKLGSFGDKIKTVRGVGYKLELD